MPTYSNMYVAPLPKNWQYGDPGAPTPAQNLARPTSDPSQFMSPADWMKRYNPTTGTMAPASPVSPVATAAPVDASWPINPGASLSTGNYLGNIGPNIGVGGVPLLNQLNLEAQQQANLSRIPGEAGLEQQSSADIAALLNPPAMFPDTSRQAAEVTAGRGVAGSAAAGGTGLRMTDEERLRRIALGQQLLSAATARNPVPPLVDPTKFVITPYQQAELDLQRYIANLNASTRRGEGGGSGRQPYSPQGDTEQAAPREDFGNLADFLFPTQAQTPWQLPPPVASPDQGAFSYWWENPAVGFDSTELPAYEPPQEEMPLIPGYDQWPPGEGDYYA
jgi:hypothetical protein